MAAFRAEMPDGIPVDESLQDNEVLAEGPVAAQLDMTRNHQSC